MTNDGDFNNDGEGNDRDRNNNDYDDYYGDDNGVEDNDENDNNYKIRNLVNFKVKYVKIYWTTTLGDNKIIVK